jgi:hypothetical protein
MIILGLSGKARAGKTRLCKELFSAAEKQGWDVFVKPFAGPLKKYVTEDLGYSKELYPKEYRENCQLIGAKKREDNPDHWVDLWYKDMVESMASEMSDAQRPALYIVDDVRYKNEIALLKSPKVGATLLFVKHKSRVIEDPTGDWRNHASEKLSNVFEVTANKDLKKLYKFDFIVDNDKEEDALEHWAENFLSFISANSPCLCEACVSNFEMREPDIDLIDEELKEFLDDVLGEEDTDDDA